MKKIYLKPEIESTILNTEWAMCTQDPTVPVGDNEQAGNPTDDFGWSNPAPRRRVF